MSTTFRLQSVAMTDKTTLPRCGMPPIFIKKTPLFPIRINYTTLNKFVNKIYTCKGGIRKKRGGAPPRRTQKRAKKNGAAAPFFCCLLCSAPVYRTGSADEGTETEETKFPSASYEVIVTIVNRAPVVISN